jgi:hypothetical protein
MKHTKNTILKMKEKQKGKTISENQRNQIRKTLQKYYNKLGSKKRSEIYGKSGRAQRGIPKPPFTEQHKINLSKSQTGVPKKQTKEHRLKIGKARRIKVSMFDKSNNFIKTFTSIGEAGKYIGTKNLGGIGLSCKNGKSKVKGFLFKYAK